MDNKGYGIVTRPGTPYKDLLDNAILKLMEGGVLHKLRVKWWKQKRGGGACESKVRNLDLFFENGLYTFLKLGIKIIVNLNEHYVVEIKITKTYTSLDK